MKEAYSAVVVTVSDRSAAGEREDGSGPIAVGMLKESGFDVVETHIVPDERNEIVPLLRRCVENGTALVVTSGGTGFAQRDITPEATLEVIERRTDGLSEAMRSASLQHTRFAMLSRGVSGIAGRTLIVNLPGSPKGVRECLEVILPVLPHGIRQIRGAGDSVHS